MNVTVFSGSTATIHLSVNQFLVVVGRLDGYQHTLPHLEQFGEGLQVIQAQDNRIVDQGADDSARIGAADFGLLLASYQIGADARLII